MHCQVTHVTEEDHVTVLTLSIITDAADSILIDKGTGVCLWERSTRRDQSFFYVSVFKYNLLLSIQVKVPCCGSQSRTPFLSGP